MSGQSKHSLTGQILAIAITFPVIATIAVALRIFTRIKIVKALGSDDWLILAALACSWVFMAMIIEQVHYGLGRHIYNLPPELVPKSLKPFFFSIMSYNLALTFTKTSIIFFYLRIFVTPRMRIACFIVLAFIIAYGIELFFAGTFTCSPVSFFWDKTIPNGKCINEKVAWFANAALNMASDFTIIILPIPAITKLNMPTRQKIVLMLILAVGLFACVTSVIRLWSLYTVANSPDPTWDNVGAAEWSCIEANVAIFCACLPAIKPLIARGFPRLFGTSGSNSAGTDGSGSSQWTVGKRSVEMMKTGSLSRGYPDRSFGPETGHIDSFGGGSFRYGDGRAENDLEFGIGGAGSRCDFGSQKAIPMTMENIPFKGFAQ